MKEFFSLTEIAKISFWKIINLHFSQKFLNFKIYFFISSDRLLSSESEDIFTDSLAQGSATFCF